MILSDTEILDHKIITVPDDGGPDPFAWTSGGLTSCGWDLTVNARSFLVSKPHAASDTSDAGSGEDPRMAALRRSQRYAQSFEVRTPDPVTGAVEIQPGEFFLCAAREHIRLPRHIRATVFPKSSLIRLGLNIFPSIAEPGWEGVLTLEGYNYSQNPVLFFHGQGVCQLCFDRISGDVKHSYPERSTRYQGATTVQTARVEIHSQLDPRMTSSVTGEEVREEAAAPAAKPPVLFVAYDTETTGFTAEDRVVSLALVPVGLDGVPLRELARMSYFNPEGRKSAKEAEAVHGLSSAFLADKPRFADKARAVWLMLRGRVLVGHNEAFDHRMLSREFKRLGSLSHAEKAALSMLGDDFDRFPPATTRICTQSLYKQLRGRDVKTSGSSVTAMKYETTLAAALSYMGIVNEQAHDAFADALATARLATALLNELDCWETYGLQRPVL